MNQEHNLSEIKKQLQDIRATLLEMSLQDEVLTVEEAADYLKVSRSKIYKMYGQGDILGHKLGGANASLRFKRSELLRPAKMRKTSILV